jgi:hypothetical protein
VNTLPSAFASSPSARSIVVPAGEMLTRWM